ncbi:hypothetical protein HK104_000480 [Borealophlyctis nickersoniae]|nr:hypothetical protein HK104_000480 [Borealophlyctis nickersoniae]
MGPSAGKPYTDQLSYFDYITPFFTSTPNICGYGGNNAGFWSTFQKWQDWAASAAPSLSLLVGLPTWFEPVWAQGANGDYVAPDEVINASVVPRLKEFKAFAGFGLQDASFDYLNRPCKDPTESRRMYSKVLAQQLALGATAGGNNTPEAQRCVVVNQAYTPPTTTNTSESGNLTGNVTDQCAFWGTCPTGNTATRGKSAMGTGWGLIASTLVISFIIAAVQYWYLD